MEFKTLYYPGFVIVGVSFRDSYFWTVKMLCLDNDVIRLYFWMN